VGNRVPPSSASAISHPTPGGTVTKTAPVQLLGWVGLGAMLSAAAAAAQTTADAAAGYFTAAQARSGASLYAEQCADCHGSRLDDGTAPPLTGAQFARTWGVEGRSLDDLFYIIRTTMPEGGVGSLSVDEYLAVTAYLLERNGFDAGTRALSADAGLLRSIRIRSGTPSGAAADAPVDFLRGARGLAPRGRGPSHAELNGAGENSRDWLYHNHDYSGARFVDLDQIDVSNVDRLRPACVFQMGGTGPFQSGPLVYDGVMYVTTIPATVAFDAATCRPLWRHEWRPRARSLGINNRGVAIKDGRVVRATSDGYLLALDAADGELLWARRIGDSSIGETFTMPPLIYDDLIIIGPAVSEYGIEGWVGAFRLENGEPVWHFNTVPGARDGTGTWGNPEGIRLGGGAVWSPLSLDPDREELYVAVSNPAPDLPAHLRPGLNLYTNSIVALDIRTGELRWYDQLVPNDYHDWDVTQVSPLITADVRGRTRNLVVTAGKDGFLRVLDRDTRERLYETAIARIENHDVPLTRDGVHSCPGINGGVLWNGPAYDPLAGLLYVGAIDWCSTFALEEEVRFVPGQMYLGGTYRPDDEQSGRVTAVDASDGSVRWTYITERAMLGGVTATAGGVVFVGELTGELVALHGRTGEVLSRFQTGGPIGAGVVSYTVSGRQYVAVASGDPSILNWRLEHDGAPTVLVFALPD
jgi:alcohol dehydrogenase (cytochrome c)